MALFANECTRCGSKEHNVNDCPHEIFSSKCTQCGSTEHATKDCPHEIFSSKCTRCGSTEHASKDCPHEIFSSKCIRCGSTEHSTKDCPHEIFSSECVHCGSKNHKTADCPNTLEGRSRSRSNESSSSSSSSDQSGCTTAILWLVGIGVAVFVAIWLAVNVVLPVALLNSALALTVLTVTFKRYKTLFAALALVGGGYMMLDVTNGWLSSIFVDKVVKDPIWISIFVYINAFAIGKSVWFLVQPIWAKSQQIRTIEKRKSILLKVLVILLVAIGTLAAPAIYHTIQNRFAKKIQLQFFKKDIIAKKQSSVEEVIAEMAKNLQQDVPPPPPPPPPPGETSKPSEPIVKKSADNMTLMFNAIRNEKNVSDTLMIIIGRDGRVFLKLGNGRDTILHFRPKILENMGSRYNITFTPMELRIFEVYDIPFGVTIRDMKPFLATFLRSNNDYERQKFEKGIPCDVADNQLYCWLLYATQVTGSINIHIDAKEGPNSAIEKAKHVLDKLSEGYLNINNSVEVIEQKQEGVQEKEEQQVFVIVEEMPEFPGGELALRNYIAKAIVYPVVAKGKGSQGKVFVTFVVNNDGSVSNAKIARGVDTSLDAEALRVVSTLPKWKPGKQRGVPVRVSYTVPVSFKLQ